MHVCFVPNENDNQDRSRIIEVYRRWLWYVDMRYVLHTLSLKFRSSYSGLPNRHNMTRLCPRLTNWLVIVAPRWDHRRMVESNMQNMQLEMALKKAHEKGSWGQSI